MQTFLHKKNFQKLLILNSKIQFLEKFNILKFFYLNFQMKFEWIFWLYNQIKHAKHTFWKKKISKIILNHNNKFYDIVFSGKILMIGFGFLSVLWLNTALSI